MVLGRVYGLLLNEYCDATLGVGVDMTPCHKGKIQSYVLSHIGAMLLTRRYGTCDLGESCFVRCIIYIVMSDVLIC